MEQKYPYSVTIFMVNEKKKGLAPAVQTFTANLHHATPTRYNCTISQVLQL